MTVCSYDFREFHSNPRSTLVSVADPLGSTREKFAGSRRCLNCQREAVLRRAAARRPSDRGARVRESAFDGASRGTRGVRRRRARAVLRRPPGRRLRGLDRRVPRVDVDAVARGEKVHAKGGGDAHSGACARPHFPGGGASGSRAARVALFSSLAPRRLRDRPPRARSRRTPPRNIT